MVTLKIGNKVRNVHDNSEGYLVYSTSGASVSGITYRDDVKRNEGGVND